MVFSAPIFLFLFLPLVLAVNLLCRRTWLSNLWLMLASVGFYAWGEPRYVALLMVIVMVNALIGVAVHRAAGGRAKALLAAAVVFNIGVLAYFKYANFFIQNVNAAIGAAGGRPLDFTHVYLPIGISFFTFHSLSYVIDIYRRATPPQMNPVNLVLYIFFFPQLIAGPIIRYKDIARQLSRRGVDWARFASGARRFILGLSKKVLIANVVAVPADAIFALPPGQLTTGAAWLGLVCYTLQIYFDFSGYSDMAIGLARLFGFDFLENFNYPYVAQSVRDFWRRWHISLSTWFRDYLYIPLGGNRGSSARTGFNLLLVFFLCGLWHGASWTFVAWGLFHGTFLVIERTRWAGLLDKAPRPLRHLYTMAVVMGGWLLFRAEDLPQVWAFLCAMAGLGAVGPGAAAHLDKGVLAAIAAGMVFSAPVIVRLKAAAGWPHALPARGGWALRAAINAAMLFLFLLSATWLAGGTYNPFIYFRF